MSKYPVKYPSASKGEVEIESMASPHIANAIRKIGTAGMEGGSLLLKCLADELLARGCTYDTESGQWVFPPKPEAEE